MQRQLKVLFTSFTLFCMGGCASWLNPYESNFKCQSMSEGKCQSLSQSYKDSFGNAEKESKAAEGGNCIPEREVQGIGNLNRGCKKEDSSEKGKNVPIIREVGKVNVINRTEGKGNAAGAPIRNPGEVVRILMFDYVDRDTLYRERYIYTERQKPFWAIGNQDVNKAKVK